VTRPNQMFEANKKSEPVPSKKQSPTKRKKERAREIQKSKEANGDGGPEKKR